VKPLIDEDFHTIPDPWATGIAGSSMGGLISLYGYLHYPQVFGFAASLSPSYWFAGGRILETVERIGPPHGRLYLDIGGKEGRNGSAYMRGVRRLADLLRAKGYNDDNFLYVEDPQGQHNEQSWARRLPAALRFLLLPLMQGITS
jgi:predicted alpha/beta superfamily hydrolase